MTDEAPARSASPDAGRASGLLRTLLPLVFFLSGVAGLIFETLWFRLAGLSLGNSVWASSLVLAAFMGGIGLGNLLAARYGERARRPLRLYAVLEVIVGGFGLGVVLVLPHTTATLRSLFGTFSETPWLVQAIRLGVAFALMVVPAAAMGVTLPVLSRVLSQQDDNFGRVLGVLYGWNTLGGVVGAVTGELLCIRALGLRGSGLVAASLNLAAALLALALAARVAESRPSEPPADEPRANSGAAWRLLAAAGVAGGLVLALEVVWFRFLQLFVNGTALAFAVMLGVILLGIGLGGLAAARWLGRHPMAPAWLPALALLGGAVTALGYATFDPRTGDGQAITEAPWAVALLAARLMLPASFLSGVMFTFLGRTLREVQAGTAQTTGRLTLANTIGATTGALAGGFLLLPTLGVERSLFLLAVAYALVAGLTAQRPRSRGQWRFLTASVALFLLAAALFPFGLMRSFFLKTALQRYQIAEAAATVNVLHREGLNETVSVLRYYWGGEPYAHRLVTNGQSMAGDTFYSRRYMKLYAYWAAAVQPRAQSALLISYGLGTTASALRDIPGLRSVDVVDISPDVLAVGDFLLEPARNPLHDPRFRVHVEDGRFFLQTTGRSFDLVTAEPPPPKLAGIVNLYSREFFAQARARLNQGGIVTYWLPIHQLTSSEARGIARGFCDVFPNCSLWRGCGSDWMLAGSRGALGPVSEESFGRLWRDERVAAHLRDIAVESPAQLGALYIADGEALSGWIGGARPLTDDRPGRLSAPVPSDAETALTCSFADAEQAHARFGLSPLVRSVWPPALHSASLQDFELQAALDRSMLRPAGTWPLADLQRVLTQTRLEVMPLAMLDSDLRYQQIARRAADRGDSAPALWHRLAIGALAERRYAEAARLFTAARSQDPSLSGTGVLEAFALGLAGRKPEGLALLRSMPVALARQTSEADLRWLEAFLTEGGSRRPNPDDAGGHGVLSAP